MFFNSAAEGKIDQLSKILKDHPRAIKLTSGSNHIAIYYSVKNLKKDTTNFLLDRGSPKLSIKTIDRLIHSEWYGSISSFYFLLKIGTSLIEETYSYSQYRKHLIDTYISICFSQRNIEKLDNFLESTKTEIDLLKYMNVRSVKPKDIEFNRELKLRIFLGK